ncbi:hypothetical protein JN06_02480 [Bacteroides zoogleoformans]|nr:hypothetical protein JN06_02480 [Bacteroides zoogleoformans]
MKSELWTVLIILKILSLQTLLTNSEPYKYYGIYQQHYDCAPQIAERAGEPVEK